MSHRGEPPLLRSAKRQYRRHVGQCRRWHLSRHFALLCRESVWRVEPLHHVASPREPADVLNTFPGERDASRSDRHSATARLDGGGRRLRPPAREDGERIMMGPYGYGIGWMAVGLITMLLFWGLVIVGIVALVRWIGAQGALGPRGSGETPLEILKRRYASGEITKEQYESMKRDIV